MRLVRPALAAKRREILLFLRHLYHAVHPAGVEPLQDARMGQLIMYTKHLWETGQLAPRLAAGTAAADTRGRPADTARRCGSALILNHPRMPPLSHDRFASTRERLPLPGAEYAQAPMPEDIAIGRPPAPGKQYVLPGSRQVSPLIHTHSAVLHLSAQSEYPDLAWELLTLLFEPVTLHEYTNIRRAIPPRQSILGLGYLDNPKTQQVIDLWLRYGRPPFDPPEYSKVSGAIRKTFQDTVIWQQDLGKGVDNLIVQLNKIAAEANPPFTGTTRA